MGFRDLPHRLHARVRRAVPQALAKLDAYVKCEIMRDLYGDSLEEHDSTNPPFDPAPNHEIAQRYENVILEDKARYDGAGMDRIRECFKQWVEEQGGGLCQK